MNYKAPDNSLHFLDDSSYADLLPQGSVPITDEEAESIRIANLPQVDPKAAIRAQIEALEAQQLLPRITREFMLAAAQAQAQAAGVDPMQNVGYAKLKQFDQLIASLREKL